MQTIIDILAVSTFALTYVITLNRWYFKPFDCERCMGFWFGLLFYFWQNDFQGTFEFTFKLITFATTTSITTRILWKQIQP